MAKTETGLQQRILEWRKDPALFVRECIGGKPSNQQEEGLALVGELATAKLKRARNEKLTARQEWLCSLMGISIRSGHGNGKDAFLSWVLWWGADSQYRALQQKYIRQPCPGLQHRALVPVEN